MMGFASLYPSYALKPRTVEAIQHALEKAGVEFIDGDKPGVRVK
jgi:hypothetical protein